MPASYDLTLLLDTSADEEQRAKILDDVEAAIAERGTVLDRQNWGVRPLAFEIRHRSDAEYYVLQFTAEAGLLSDLERSLSITDAVMRYRIIRFRQDASQPGVPSEVAGTGPRP